MPTFFRATELRRVVPIAKPSRSAKRLRRWKKRDSVELARARLLEVLPETELTVIEEQVKEAVAESVRFADQSPPAQESTIWSTVYAQPGTDPRRM